MLFSYYDNFAVLFHQGMEILLKGLVGGIVTYAASSRLASKAEYAGLTARQLMLMEGSLCSQILLNSGSWVFEKFLRSTNVVIVGCACLRWILVIDWSLPKNTFMTSAEQLLTVSPRLYTTKLRSSMFHKPEPTWEKSVGVDILSTT